MRCALLVVAACAKPPPPRLEHHAAAATDETFVLDAPLFFGDAPDTVRWTLERHGHAVTLALGDDTFTGTFEESGGRIAIEVTGAERTVTLACERRGAQVHVAAAVPEPRGEHPVCSVPRAWQPADLVRVAALGCLVQRDDLKTEITLAPPPGLQAVVDDCCDDSDDCQRRWEMQLRRSDAR